MMDIVTSAWIALNQGADKEIVMADELCENTIVDKVDVAKNDGKCQHQPNEFKSDGAADTSFIEQIRSGNYYLLDDDGEE